MLVTLSLLILARNRKSLGSLVLLGAFGVSAHLVLDLSQSSTPVLWPLLNESFWIPVTLYLHMGSAAAVTGRTVVHVEPTVIEHFIFSCALTRGGGPSSLHDSCCAHASPDPTEQADNDHVTRMASSGPSGPCSRPGVLPSLKGVEQLVWVHVCKCSSTSIRNGLPEEREQTEVRPP